MLRFIVAFSHQIQELWQTSGLSYSTIFPLQMAYKVYKSLGSGHQVDIAYIEGIVDELQYHDGILKYAAFHRCI
jgi:hypothetical protein